MPHRPPKFSRPNERPKAVDRLHLLIWAWAPRSVQLGHLTIDERLRRQKVWIVEDQHPQSAPYLSRRLQSMPFKPFDAPFRHGILPLKKPRTNSLSLTCFQTQLDSPNPQKTKSSRRNEWSKVLSKWNLCVAVPSTIWIPTACICFTSLIDENPQFIRWCSRKWTAVSSNNHISLAWRSCHRSETPTAELFY